MKKVIVVTLVSLLGSVILGSAVELSPVDVVRAHEAGVTTELLLGLIDSANKLDELTPAAEASLRGAGVAEEVITAYRLRSGSGVQTPAATSAVQPDDRRLEDVAKLVRSGLAEELVVEHVRKSATSYQLTVNDLIYLKQQQVPGPIIKAMLERQSPAPAPAPAPATRVAAPAPTRMSVAAPSPAPAPAPAVTQSPPPVAAESLTFAPLTRFTKAVGVLKRKTDGRLIIGNGKIQWVDEEKSDLSFEIFDSVLKKVYLECEAASCFELRLKTVHGDTYRFRDLDWKAGGNAQIMAVWETLKINHPKVRFLRKD